jgi:cysteine desulfurase family protein (TIGR01976 family)
MTTDATPVPPELPVDWVREQFPALEGSGILFDNAGGSAPLGRVADLVSEYMRRWPVQLGASYAESAEASERLSFARQEIAGILEASSSASPTADEIVIGASTSSLLSRLARSLAPSLGAGDEIIVTDVDHEANITPWRRLADSGVNVLTWNLNADSQRLEPEDLRKLLSDRTRLVCFTHASNILGETTPVARITRLAHDYGARVVVDGVAYAPHRPMDVRRWEVDFYAFSLYKVYGPHCAVLYVRGPEMESLANLNHQFMDGSHGPGKLEPGAFPYELLYGAGGVPEYLRELSGQVTGDRESSSLEPAYAAIGTHEERLSSRLLSFLSSEPAVRIVGDERPGPARLPTISFVVDGCRSSEIPVRLDPQGIGIRWGHFYAPRLIDRLGLAQRDGVVRVSMVHYNTLEEVDRLISGLAPILSGAAS